MAKVKAEYIWIDGAERTAGLRSKTKLLDRHVGGLEDLPAWGFDGSSTEQAEGHASDCLLKPVFCCPDPIRGEPHVLVLCEVFQADGQVHPSNHRAALRIVAKQYEAAEPWFGIEQEYTLFRNGRPLGWPEGGFPGPQGPYYCSVGDEKVFGRDLVEEHLDLCLAAGLEISGVNAEVMPGQWEYQVGPLGPLEVADQLWVARYLLERAGESHGISVSLHPKPVQGDWNGAGAHTNVSTKAMREQGGLALIEAACEKLSRIDARARHIAVYGADNEQRLTGKHETCSIDQFRWGVSDRGASIRIPMAVAVDKQGYFEDRRPAANMDPYQVCRVLIETISGA